MNRNIHILSASDSIFNEFMAEMRSEEIQKDSMRFRKNLERVGELFAYEISKTLPYAEEEIVTPLGISTMPRLKCAPVLASIMRAGMPMHMGFLNFFDRADNAFVSAFRKYYRDGTFEIQIDYLSSPDLKNRIVILMDSMLATGQSMELAYNELLTKGKPAHTHIVSAIASHQGVDYIRKHLPGSRCTLWVGAIDEELTALSYIVPGLGDAGDLAYGSKTCTDT